MKTNKGENPLTIMMMKIRLFSICLILASYGCNSQKNRSGEKQSLEISKQKVQQNETIRDVIVDTSFHICSNVIVNAYGIDSIIAEITFINQCNQSIWLYKPILPSDSLIENSFQVRIDRDFKEISHIHKKTDHQYLSGDQEFLPSIDPVINKNSQIEFLPGTKLIFKTNLSKHYDFRSIELKSANSFVVYYQMRFPLIINEKQVWIPDSLDSYIQKPVYFNVLPENFRTTKIDELGTTFHLPK